MAEVGLQGVETYISCLHNTMAQYIATGPIMDLCLESKWKPGPIVTMLWWEQGGLDLEGTRMASLEAEQMEKGEETDRIENATENYLNAEDTVVNITLGTEPNATLSYALRLELHHPIMSKLGEHG